jgi:hypothetical protein
MNDAAFERRWRVWGTSGRQRFSGSSKCSRRLMAEMQPKMPQLHMSLLIGSDVAGAARCSPRNRRQNGLPDRGS